MKKVVVFDNNFKVIENQLKMIESIALSIVETTPKLKTILEKKPDIIIINQNNIQSCIKKIFEQPNPLQLILITESGPEKLSFEAWSNPAHVVKRGDWDQLKLTVKEVLSSFD